LDFLNDLVAKVPDVEPPKRRKKAYDIQLQLLNLSLTFSGSYVFWDSVI
jgi:hypothetical protein